MTTLDTVLAVRTVAQMPQQYLTCNTYIILQPLCVFGLYRKSFIDGSKFFLYIFKDIRHGRGTHRPVPTDVSITGFYVKLNRGNSRTILSTVVLLLHE